MVTASPVTFTWREAEALSVMERSSDASSAARMAHGDIKPSAHAASGVEETPKDSAQNSP